MHQATQAEIDAALVECLRIFARRGRQLREERERQGGSDNQQRNPTEVDKACEPSFAQQKQTAPDVALVEGDTSSAADADDGLTLIGERAVANRG